MVIAAPATAAATRWLPTSSTATTRGTAGCGWLTCRLSWRTRPARQSTPAPSGPSPPPWGRLLREAAGLHQRAGVDADLLAGDVARLVAGQEDGQVRDVLGLDVGDGHGLEGGERQLCVLTAHGLAGAGEVGTEQGVEALVVHQVGVAVCRVDGVHPDEPRRQLQRHLLEIGRAHV